MTSLERAEKMALPLLVYMTKDEHWRDLVIDFAAQIAEAEREVLEHSVSEEIPIYFRKGYAEGFAAARERARGICDELTEELDSDCKKVFSVKFKAAIKTMNGSVVSEECSARIAAMEPEGTK